MVMVMVMVMVSGVALWMSISKVPWVSQSVSDSVTRSPIELFWTAKKCNILDKNGFAWFLRREILSFSFVCLSVYRVNGSVALVALIELTQLSWGSRLAEWGWGGYICLDSVCFFVALKPGDRWGEWAAYGEKISWRLLLGHFHPSPATLYHSYKSFWSDDPKISGSITSALRQRYFYWVTHMKASQKLITSIHFCFPPKVPITYFS